MPKRLAAVFVERLQPAGVKLGHPGRAFDDMRSGTQSAVR